MHLFVYLNTIHIIDRLLNARHYARCRHGRNHLGVDLSWRESSSENSETWAMVHTHAGYGKGPEGGLLHGRSPTLLLGSCDSAGAERQGRHPLETRESGEGQCLEQDDHGQKARRHERVLCFFRNSK